MNKRTSMDGGGAKEGHICRACSSLPFPMHRASAYGHIECLRELLAKEKKKKTDLFLDLDGRTPLHVAAESGQLMALKYLIENTKISPYHRNCRGETCAHSATCTSTGTGSLECIQYLLSLPACKGGRHPLALEKDYRGNTVLHLAAQIGNNDIAFWLLQTYGQTIANMPNTIGQLPLHMASARGNLEFIRIATKYDLQMVNKRDETGATPAFYAARGGDLACLKYLVEKTRADVNTLTIKGHSLLHVASLCGRTEVVQWLMTVMKKNALVQTSHDSATAFHCAAFGGQTAVLRILQKAANGKKKYITTSADRQGNTPIHLAGMNNHLECVQYLLESGADPKLKNKSGHTAIEMAARNGHHRTAWLLSNYKAGKGTIIFPTQSLPVVGPASVSTSGYGSYAAPMTPPFSDYTPSQRPSMAWRQLSVPPVDPPHQKRESRQSPWNLLRRDKNHHSSVPTFFNAPLVADKESITERANINGRNVRFYKDKQVQTDTDSLLDNVIFVQDDQLNDSYHFKRYSRDMQQPRTNVLRYDDGANLYENIDEVWRKAPNIDSLDHSSNRSLSLSTDFEAHDIVDEEECIAATEHIDRALEETSEISTWNKPFKKGYISPRRRRDSPRPNDLGPPMSPPIFYDPENKRSSEVRSRLFAF